MTSRKSWLSGMLGVAMTASAVQAQAPPALPPGLGAGAPSSSAVGAAASALGGGATPAVATATSVSQPTTLWGFLGLSKSNLAACKAKLCQSQLGMMVNNLATGPVAGVSGGFIPPLCPAVPNPAAIAAMPGGPQGAQAVAAKIQASEADAKARVAAVEYLGTVDCTHWPEAKVALLNALREDPNECVRFAAARALNSGCCCSKEVIERLGICVAGKDTDNAPPETSPRVKAAAFAALQNCLMRVPEAVPVETPPAAPPLERERGAPPEPLPPPPLRRDLNTTGAPAAPEVMAAHLVREARPSAFQQQLRRKTFNQTAQEARQILIDVSRNSKAPSVLPPGKRSLYHVLLKTRQDLASRNNHESAQTASPTEGR